jgi:uncharacterized Zn-binding protein involved in type VI secretion
MPGVQRKGDANILGGIALGGEASVRVNGRPVLVNGKGVSSHPCCGRRGCSPLHCFCLTKGGNPSVRAAGVPIITNNATDQCGHARIGGSTNVRIG